MQTPKKDFSAAIKLDSRYAEAFYELGNIYFRAGKAKKALPLYDQALSNTKNPMPKLILKRQMHCSEMGQFGFALPQYKEVEKVEIATLYKLNTKSGRVSATFHNRNVAEARNQLMAVSNPNPKQKADITYANGCADLIEGKMDEALEKLEVALRDGKY